MASRPSRNIEDDVQEILFPQGVLKRRIAELGRQISIDYARKAPLLIGVLRGVVPFMADLLREITIPVQVDYMAISPYGASSRSGTVRITKDLDENINGRHVLFIEDVIDTGLSLSYLLRTLRTRDPESIEVCVLFDRPYRRLIDIPLAYQGFELPDRFVVGYGLDVNGYYRNLPYVGVLKPDLI